MTNVFCSEPMIAAYFIFPLILLAGSVAHPPGRGRSDYFLSVIATMTAVGLGVVAAAFASPSENTEGAMFKLIAGIIVAFTTGFLVKRYESEINKFPVWIKDGLNAARFWMFMCAFLASAILTYVYRAYFFESKTQAELVRDLSADLEKVQNKLQAVVHSASEPSSNGK